jgi:predicted transcriptional regulator
MTFSENANINMEMIFVLLTGTTARYNGIVKVFEEDVN